MEKDDIKRGGFVYLRFMRFPDSQTIDYKLNGRPYLIYKVDDEYAYLLKIGSDRHLDEDFYLKIVKRTLKGKKRECYIDLRVLIKISKEELVEKANTLLSENRKYTSHIHFISEEDLNKLEEKIERLCMIDQFKEVYSI